MGRGAEEILWNIFTFYSLNGNPRDPGLLNGTSFVKLCKDVMTMDQMMTERPITQAEINLIYTSEIKNAIKTKKQQTRLAGTEKLDKLEFDQFVTSLIHIAVKCYPSSQSKEEAMQQLLLENILPLASRRAPISVSKLMNQSPIESLFKYYEDSFLELFMFYCSSTEGAGKSKNITTSYHSSQKTFDEQNPDLAQGLQESPNNRTRANSNSSNVNNKNSQNNNNTSLNSPVLNSPNSRQQRMAYADFVYRFANDFGLQTSLGLTNLELGEIFLSSTSINNFSTSLRKMEFSEFWEAFVRCALVAFKSKTEITTENKVKGLLLYVWKYLQNTVTDHMTGYGTMSGGGFNAYKGRLIKGAQMLNERFVSAWTKDEYKDYVESSSKMSSPVKSPQKKQNLQSSLSLQSQQLSSDNNNSNNNTSFLGKILSDTNAIITNKPLSIPTNNNNKSKQKDYFNLIHDNVEKKDMFSVYASDGLLINIMINNDDDLHDNRIKHSDLRKLLYNRPDLAELLYECVCENENNDVIYDKCSDYEEDIIDDIIENKYNDEIINESINGHSNNDNYDNYNNDNKNDQNENNNEEEKFIMMLQNQKMENNNDNFDAMDDDNDDQMIPETD
eukprot:gene14795-19879_t